MSNRVRVPAVGGLESAVRIFYENTELRTATIKELFPGVSQTKITKLKLLARAKMAEEGVETFDSTAVNTSCAYASWGLDIKDLEHRLHKVRRLSLTGGFAE